MAETLCAGSAIVEALGNHLGLDMRGWWQPDDAFFDLLRDRQVANEMLADIGGRHVADGNSSQKLKTQKDHSRLAVRRERPRTSRWLAAPLDGVPGVELHRTRRLPHRRSVGEGPDAVRVRMIIGIGGRRGVEPRRSSFCWATSRARQSLSDSTALVPSQPNALPIVSPKHPAR
ncbi:hypothetical protein ACVOMV_18220 [Mesorhizobium atlanticum]